jgi:hypothetical protein
MKLTIILYDVNLLVFNSTTSYFASYQVVAHRASTTKSTSNGRESGLRIVLTVISIMSTKSCMCFLLSFL